MPEERNLSDDIQAVLNLLHERGVTKHGIGLIGAGILVSVETCKTAHAMVDYIDQVRKGGQEEAADYEQLH